MNKVEWKYSKGQVSEAAITELERYFQATFPSFYKTIIRRHNGARPRPCRLRLEGGREVQLRSFLPVGKQHADNIVAVNRALKTLLPAQVVAFANDDNGNYFAFRFRAKEVEVIFWEHETGDISTLSTVLFEELAR